MVSELSSIDVAMLREGMEVRGAAGKLLGKVGEIVGDGTGQPVNFTIQHGILGRKRKVIPVHEIKQVTDEGVVVKFTLVEFKELADIE